MTQIWINEQTGHHYSEGADGASLNGSPVEGKPDWAVGRGPDVVFGAFFPWHGGDCPVPPDTEVRCLFRGRRPYVGPAIWPSLPDSAKANMWKHAPAPGRPDPMNDIVAYQVRVG